MYVDEGGCRYVIDTGNDRLVGLRPPITEGHRGSHHGRGPRRRPRVGIVTVSGRVHARPRRRRVQTDADGDYQAAVPPGTTRWPSSTQTGAYDFEYFQDGRLHQLRPLSRWAPAVTTADLAVSQPFPPPPGPLARSSAPSRRALPRRRHVGVGGRQRWSGRAGGARPAGDYRIAGVEVATTSLLFLDQRGVNATEFYDDAVDPTFADLVVVTAGVTTTADADLQPDRPPKGAGSVAPQRRGGRRPITSTREGPDATTARTESARPPRGRRATRVSSALPWR